MTELERNRMEEMVRRLNEASEAYYGGKDEIMSNFEWDALFDELTRLEDETGVTLPDSPTQKVNTASEDNIAGENQEGGGPAGVGGRSAGLAELEAGRTHPGADL